MVRIFEGVDGAGKTYTINKFLETHPDYEVIHCTRETPNNLDWFASIYVKYKNLVMDRSHIGQFIYQDRNDRKNNEWLSLYDLCMIETLLKGIGYEITYVYNDPRICLYNCKRDREDSHYTLDYIEDLDRRYRYFFENITGLETTYYKNDFYVDLEAIESERVGSIDYSKIPETWGVDFDGCLAYTRFPDIISPNIELINRLKTARKNGIKLVLWTNRTNNHLLKAVDYCRGFGLEFDAVNDNVEEVKKLGLDPRKIYCSKYFDDKAVCVSCTGIEA